MIQEMMSISVMFPFAWNKKSHINIWKVSCSSKKYYNQYFRWSSFKFLEVSVSIKKKIYPFEGDLS